MEMYVHFAMGRTGSHQASVEVVLLGDPATVAKTKLAWQSFDAEGCNCFDPKDKVHLLGVIEKGCGDLSAFNAEVRGLLQAFDCAFSNRSRGRCTTAFSLPTGQGGDSPPSHGDVMPVEDEGDAAAEAERAYTRRKAEIEQQQAVGASSRGSSGRPSARQGQTSSGHERLSGLSTPPRAGRWAVAQRHRGGASIRPVTA